MVIAGNGDRLAAASEEESSDWRVFKHDTEAGRLLSRLYGVTPGGKPQINYPKLKTRTNRPDQQQARSHWKGGRDSDRTGFDRSRAATVAAPKVGRGTRYGGGAATAAVALIPRRKNEIACQEELTAIESVRHAFRPAHDGGAYSTDVEKDRLNELFTFGGGAALPEELTLPEAPLPSEERSRKAERRRVDKARRRRRARLNGDAADGDSTDSDGEDGREASKGHGAGLFDHILGEIEDRRTFQFSMEETGSGASTRAQVAEEISARVKELMKLDKDRATKIIKGFQK